MTKIKDEYRRWLLSQLARWDLLFVLGAVIWLKWRHYLPLPRVDPASPAWWTSPIFFLVGLAGGNYYLLSGWWTDLQIRWAIRMMMHYN